MNGATTIQERLKDLRLNKGLKLEELAEQTGISKSALGSYEKDDYKEINHGNLILLAESCWQIFMGCPSIISFAGQRTWWRSTRH